MNLLRISQYTHRRITKLRKGEEVEVKKSPGILMCFFPPTSHVLVILSEYSKICQKMKNLLLVSASFYISTFKAFQGQKMIVSAYFNI